jgi:hypothetical protein
VVASGTPPLSASWPAAKKGAFAAACVACSPRRRCAAHKRSAVLSAAPQRARAADAALTAAAEQRASRSVHLQQAYCVPELDAGARARVLAAATGAADTAAPSVAEMRDRMGGDKRAAAPRLCTAWSADANEPRSRVRAMLAAGWRPVPGTLAGHPRWERTLQAGPFVGLRQVLYFSSTYSTFCWTTRPRTWSVQTGRRAASAEERIDDAGAARALAHACAAGNDGSAGVALLTRRRNERDCKTTKRK